MGYSHYLRIEKEIPAFDFEEIQLDARILVGTIREELLFAVAGPMGSGEPVLTGPEIMLNGSTVGDNDYESLNIEATPGFTFVKTGFSSADRRPYDLLVCAILARVKAWAGASVTVATDGTEAEWEPALALVDRVFGRQQLRFAGIVSESATA